jgi:hypothetical protein
LELHALQPADVVKLAGILTGHSLDAGTSDGRVAHSDVSRAGRVGEFGTWLAGQTGGYPLYLVQALRMLLEEGVLRVLPVGDSGWAIAVPDSMNAEHEERLATVLLPHVQTHLAERLSHLGDIEGDLLAAAAILAGRFTDQRVIEVASVDEDSGLRALDVLVRERLLRETGEDEGYDFTHGLIREAVVAEAGTARRRVYQRRALAGQHRVAPRSEPLQQALAG